MIRMLSCLLLLVGLAVLFGVWLVTTWQLWRRERCEDALDDARWERNRRRERIAKLERELGIGQGDAPAVPVATPNEARSACGCAVVVNDGLHGYFCPDEVVVAEFDPDAVGYFYR